MLICAIIAFFSAAGIYFIFQCIKRALFRKITFSDKLRVDTLVSVYGDVPELELLLKRLKSKGECGRIYLRLCLKDAEIKLWAEKLAAINHIEIIN